MSIEATGSGGEGILSIADMMIMLPKLKVFYYLLASRCVLLDGVDLGD